MVYLYRCACIRGLKEQLSSVSVLFVGMCQYLYAIIVVVIYGLCQSTGYDYKHSPLEMPSTKWLKCGIVVLCFVTEKSELASRLYNRNMLR